MRLAAKALIQWSDSWSLSAPRQAILLFPTREENRTHPSERLSRLLTHIVSCKGDYYH